MVSRRHHLLALLAVTWVACGDYQISLPNHYILGRIQSDSFVIAAPDHKIVLGPSIKRYAIVRDFVVGVEAREYSAESYFVLNTSTGVVEHMQSSNEWRRRLQELAMSEPLLAKPQRSQAR